MSRYNKVCMLVFVARDSILRKWCWILMLFDHSVWRGFRYPRMSVYRYECRIITTSRFFTFFLFYQQEGDEQIGDGVDLYDDVLTSSTSIKQELNGKEKISTLSSHISSNSLHGSSSLIGTPLQLHSSNSSSQSKRVQLYVGNLTWVRLFKPFHL